MPKIRVKLPKELGGTAIINMREGETPDDTIERRLTDIKSHQVTAEDVDGNFLEGMGAGFTNVGRRATNMLLPDPLTPEWASDEAIEKQEDIDKYLTWGHGGGGKLAGEMLATVPLSGGAGATVARGAAGLARAGRGGKYLANTLNRGLGRGAVEGATIGATMADPGERGTGAAVGGIFGGALGGAGTAVGKALGKGRAVKRLPEAVRLAHRARVPGEREAFIPLSQAAEDSLVKNIYSSFIANMPGSANVLRGQFDDAVANVRRYAAEHAMPDTLEAHTLVNLTGKESIEQLMDKLSRYWGRPGGPSPAFDVIKPYNFRVFKEVDPRIPKWLEEMLHKEVRSGIKIPRAGKVVEGEDILELRTALGSVARKLGPKDAAVARAVRERLNDLIRRNLNPNGKGRGAAARALESYENAMAAYPHWRALNRAVDEAKKRAGEFKPGDLSKAAYTSSSRSQKGPLQRTGDLATKALVDFPSRNSIYQTIAAVATGTTVAGTLMGSAPVALLAPAVMALARLGATKGLQRYLMGMTKGQRLSRTLLNKHKEELQRLGFSGRQAAVMLGVKDAT
jgi:hypothetical protein